MRSQLLIFFLILLTCSGLLRSQDLKRIDSLKKIIPLYSDKDTVKVDLLSDLAFQVSYLNLDSGIIIAQQALTLSKKLNYAKGAADALNTLGTIYYDKADYKKAIEQYTEARKALEDQRAPSLLVAIYANLANTHIALKDYNNARHFMFEAKKLVDESGSKRALFSIYATLGEVYYMEDVDDSAIFYFDKALAVKTADKGNFSAIYSSRAYCYLDQKKYDLAEESFLTGFKIAKEIGSEYYYNGSLQGLGELYVMTGRYKEAEEILTKVLKYFHDNSLKRNEMAVVENLYKMYNAQKKYDLALKYHVNYMNIKDSINNAETNKIARELEKKYEDQKKRAQIEQLNAENLASEAENERKGMFLLFAVVGCALVIVALGFAIYAFINKRKANIELQTLHREVSKQKNELFDKNKNITDSILYAHRIQNALLSSRSYIKENVNDFFIVHKPKDIVSGDFYWAQRSGDDLFFMLADCTGHGVPGAFMSLLGISYLNELVVGQKIKETDKILNGLRANIVKALTDTTYEMKDGMDGVLCRFNFKRSQLSYSAANNSIIIIRDKNIIELNGDKMPVGRSPRDKENFTAYEFVLQKNDVIYLFTDGFPDQFGGPNGKKLKQKALKELLLNWHTLPFDQQESSLSNYFEEWRNELEQIDDVTLVGFKV
jgi:serine phosphatase RsbU (regulator of sigma subunit)/lipopolysaccharide biosynthesis regulator YciM